MYDVHGLSLLAHGRYQTHLGSVRPRDGDGASVQAMKCHVCGEPFDHRASSHQGPECDRCSEEKMSDNIHVIFTKESDRLNCQCAACLYDRARRSLPC